MDMKGAETVHRRSNHSDAGDNAGDLQQEIAVRPSPEQTDQATQEK